MRKLDPDVKDERRRFRALARLAKAIGTDPWLLLDLQEEAQATRRELREGELLRRLGL